MTHLLVLCSLVQTPPFAQIRTEAEAVVRAGVFVAHYGFDPSTLRPGIDSFGPVMGVPAWQIVGTQTSLTVAEDGTIRSYRDERPFVPGPLGTPDIEGSRKPITTALRNFYLRATGATDLRISAIRYESLASDLPPRWIVFATRDWALPSIIEDSDLFELEPGTLRVLRYFNANAASPGVALRSTVSPSVARTNALAAARARHGSTQLHEIETEGPAWWQPGVVNGISNVSPAQLALGRQNLAIPVYRFLFGDVATGALEDRYRRNYDVIIDARYGSLLGLHDQQPMFGGGGKASPKGGLRWDLGEGPLVAEKGGKVWRGRGDVVQVATRPKSPGVPIEIARGRLTIFARWHAAEGLLTEGGAAGRPTLALRAFLKG